MTIKGYLFYDNGSMRAPVPPDFAKEYAELPALLSDLNGLLERAETDTSITMSGYLLYDIDS